MNKHISFDRNTRDYVATINGEIVGFASTYLEADDMANDAMYNIARNSVTIVRTTEILDAVVALKDKVDDTLTNAQRNAFDKAYNYILENDSVLYNRTTGEVVVESATSDNLSYTAGATCQCKAFEGKKLCWHRVLARIVKRAMETR